MIRLAFIRMCIASAILFNGLPGYPQFSGNGPYGFAVVITAADLVVEIHFDYHHLSPFMIFFIHKNHKGLNARW